MANTALITGVSGQDGANLAKALLQRGYRVVGAYRRTSGINVGRLNELGIADDVELIDMELLEESNVRRALRLLKPDEIYNLAAQSFVGLSFEQPLYTADTDALGVMRVLEAMREICPGARFYQASSSEMSARRNRCRRTRRRRSIRGALMAWPSCSAIGASSTIARPTASSPAPASCSITRARCADATSSPAR